jgi:hypothetical protein
MTGKEWVKKVTYLTNCIAVCNNNIERYRTRLESCTSPTDKVGRGVNENYIEKYIDLINMENEKIMSLKAEKENYKEVIYRLKDEKYQTLLNLKYFTNDLGLSWKEVAIRMNKSQSYIKGYLYNEAINKLNGILDELLNIKITL